MERPYMKTDIYHAFMLDHVAGSLSDDMALAAELHLLLNHEASAVCNVWAAAQHALWDKGHKSPSQLSHQVLPEALELACGDFETVPWMRGLSGVHYARRGPGRGKLMRLDPGQSAPAHSHSALEVTVVLKGAFEDGLGVHDRGDLVLASPGIRHRPAAYGDEMCICFVAQESLPFWRLS